MSDEEYFEQLCSNSIDGTLTDAEKERLEAHLAECSSCAALEADLQQMRALFLTEEEMPASLHASIMEGLEKEAKCKVVQLQKPVRRLPVFTMVAAAAVVMMVVLGGGLGEIFGRVNISGDTTNASTQTEIPIVAREVQAEVEENADQAWLRENKAPVTEPDSGSIAAQPEKPAVTHAESRPGDKPEGQLTEQEPSEKTAVMALPPEDSGTATVSETPDASAQLKKAPRAVGTLRMPESLRGKYVAHCYLASGTAEIPNIDGELLLTEDVFSYFLMENSMTLIQDTLKAFEDAGYSVSAYEGVGLTFDSKADSWLLIVSKT